MFFRSFNSLQKSYISWFLSPEKVQKRNPLFSQYFALQCFVIQQMLDLEHTENIVCVYNENNMYYCDSFDKFICFWWRILCKSLSILYRICSLSNKASFNQTNKKNPGLYLQRYRFLFTIRVRVQNYRQSYTTWKDFQDICCFEGMYFWLFVCLKWCLQYFLE